MAGNTQAVISPPQSVKTFNRDGDAALKSMLTAVLDQLAEPLVLLDRYRDLVFTNVTACRLGKSNGGFNISNGRFSTGCAESDRELDKLLESMSERPEDGTIVPRQRGLRVPRRGLRRDWAIILHRLIVDDASEYMQGPVFLLQAHSRITMRACIAGVLMDCYGATHAEAAAASAVLSAGSTKGASRSLHRSSETVRSHLKSLFRRCDVHSKTELGALLWSSTLFAASDHEPARASKEFLETIESNRSDADIVGVTAGCLG
jgi:DNA-binding CsgD family transcriptional regulator